MQGSSLMQMVPLITKTGQSLLAYHRNVHLGNIPCLAYFRECMITGRLVPSSFHLKHFKILKYLDLNLDSEQPE